MGKRAKETQNTNKANCDREEYARMIQEKNKIGQPRINQLAEKKSPQRKIKAKNKPMKTK